MTEQEFIDQFINAPYAALPQPGPAPLPHVFMGDPSARFNPPPQLPSGGFLNPGMPFTSLGQFQGGLTQNQAYNQVTSGNPQVSPAAAAAAASGSAPPSPNASNGPNNSLFSFSNPFYANVTSPKLNDQGNQIGTTPLNNRQFATPEMARALAAFMGNNAGVVRNTYGAFAPSETELGIQFNGQGPVLNAGLLYDRLQNTAGYNPDYVKQQTADELSYVPGGAPRVSAFGVQPTANAMTSADAERLYAGNPTTDPNVNAMGQAWKQAETGFNYFPQTTTPSPSTSYPASPTGRGQPNTTDEWLSGGGVAGGTFRYRNPNYTGAQTGNAQNQVWQSYPGSSTASSYANNLNARRPYLPQNYNSGNRLGYSTGYTGQSTARTQPLPHSFAQRSTSGTPFGR